MMMMKCLSDISPQLYYFCDGYLNNIARLFIVLFEMRECGHTILKHI